jgi:hypothetical protein
MDMLRTEIRDVTASFDVACEERESNAERLFFVLSFQLGCNKYGDFSFYKI